MFCLALITVLIFQTIASSPDNCTAIASDTCKDELDYSSTSLDADAYAEAIATIKRWKPLEDSDCYSDLRKFLCGSYLPRCGDEAKPCNALCVEARDGCSPIMNQANYSWPERFDCDTFSSSPQNYSVCV
uniref:Secreted frizzled-related protein-4 n=1 Tax=Hofstenia miamia TaxID=442651 RepID=A0A068CNG9_HOFMI|nr:secreted frizzled-related protein-4 [Hofstenia miamia]